MFIATAITNQSKLRRSATKVRYTLRSSGAANVSRRVSINISSLRDLCVQETCSKKQEVRPFVYTERRYNVNNELLGRRCRTTESSLR